MGVPRSKPGDRFGRLELLRRVPSPNGGNKVAWECICDCGTLFITNASNLQSGATHSCGCFRKETTINRNTVHGSAGTPLYKKWRGMLDRCHNQNSTVFHHYGGRGVEVCTEWRESFEAFRDWALANGYEKGLTIERNDVDGNYEPDNCRWIPRSMQNRNKRNSLRILDGSLLIDYCSKNGIPYGTGYARLKTNKIRGVEK